MPELPEVETVRLQLLHKVVGKTISEIKVYNPKTVGVPSQFIKTLTNKSIRHIDRIGKLLIFSFVDNNDLFLLAHLKMTGQFFYTDKEGITGGGHSLGKNDSLNLPNRHTRVAFYFADKSALFFNDMRMFGYIKLAKQLEVTAAKARFGQEPISADFDTKTFTKRLLRRQTSIKAALLDQTFVAGLGNIYVDEALFAAKVRPDRKASSLSPAEAKAVIKAGGQIMNHSIAIGGTTFQHFADTDGNTGNFTKYLKVFGKQKTNCPRCKKTQIQKTRVAGRGTHFCPNCQK